MTRDGNNEENAAYLLDEGPLREEPTGQLTAVDWVGCAVVVVGSLAVCAAIVYFCITYVGVKR